MKHPLLISTLALLAAGAVGKPARAHDVTPPTINGQHPDGVDWYLIASTGVQYPQQDEVVNGGEVVEQSDSNHYVQVVNIGTVSASTTFDYRMGLYHDLEDQPHSTKNSPADGDSTPTLMADESYTVGAGLSKRFNIPIGDHSVHATADLRLHGRADPWTVAPSHWHDYSRQN